MPEKHVDTGSELDRALHSAVTKREEVKEAAYREERARKDEEFFSRIGIGGVEMTKEELKKVIDSDKRMYYRTEALNDKLYIHYKGWRQLKNLEGWTGLRALYGESNAFDRIEGLTNCRSLRSLFLQENCIKRIEGLEGCPDLWSINLSNNFIERIEGLSQLRKLNTLTIARNKLGFGGVDDLEHLSRTTISSLDLQGNRIADADILPEVLMQMADLRVLYLKDNAVCKKIMNYRKSTTAYCRNLRYLDDRPVFEDDRRAAEAFNRGGMEEERAERKLMREEKLEKEKRNRDAFQEMIATSRREKRERTDMRREDKYTDETDPVDSYERRYKRMHDKWKEDNADDLKDDPKEYAEACLRAEKHNQPPPEPPASMASEEEKSSARPASPKDESEAKPPDNRKLVYEDIWDDDPVPVAKPSSSAAPAGLRAASAASTAAASSSSVASTAGTSEVFLPWATGNVADMAGVTPSKAAVERRMREMLAHKAPLNQVSAVPLPADPADQNELDEMD